MPYLDDFIIDVQINNYLLPMAHTKAVCSLLRERWKQAAKKQDSDNNLLTHILLRLCSSENVKRNCCSNLAVFVINIYFIISSTHLKIVAFGTKNS